MPSIDLEDIPKRKDELIKSRPQETEDDDDDTEDLEEVFQGLLTDALHELKVCAVAFEYVANPELIRNLTKRERDMMLRRTEAIWELANKISETLDGESEE